MKTSQSLITQLTDRLNEIQKIIKKLSSSPNNEEHKPHHLIIQSKNNHAQYYYQDHPGKKNRKYIRKKDLEFAKSIAQDTYEASALPLLQKEETGISELLKIYENHNLEHLYTNYIPARKALISPIIIPDNEYAKNWQSQPYIGKPFSDKDDTEYYTNKHERVRSKSEIIIANILKDKNIPYKYECPIYLKNSLYPNPIYPDFTILNVRTRKVYYLEHLGKMDNEEYINDNMPRIHNYQKNGILLGDQLLITYETSKKILDIPLFEQMIECFFV